MKYSAGRILFASFFSHSRLRCYLKFAVLWVLLHSSLSGWPLDLVAGTEKGRSIGLSRSIWEDWLEWWPELWAARFSAILRRKVPALVVNVSSRRLSCSTVILQLCRFTPLLLAAVIFATFHLRTFSSDIEARYAQCQWMPMFLIELAISQCELDTHWIILLAE